MPGAILERYVEKITLAVIPDFQTAVTPSTRPSFTLSVRRCTVLGRAVLANRHSMPKRDPSNEVRSSTSSTFRIIFQESLHELVARAKVSLSQAVVRRTEVGNIVLGGVGENAQRSQNIETKSPSFLATFSIVHQQRVRRNLYG